MRQLMALADSDTAKARPYINTGGPLDIVNGKFMPTVDGGYVLSGGLGVTTGVIAEPNKFKSALINGASVNAMARWPESNFILYDTEGSTIDYKRLASMSNLYLDEPEKRAAHQADLISRTKIYDTSTDEGESLDAFFDFLKEIRDDKIKNAKTWTVETEIIDPDTMKPFRMMIPTFVNIDSWTEAPVRQLNVKNEEHNADTEMKDQRTINMEEGWQKVRLMRQLPNICPKAGINLSMSGHLGKKIAMGTTPNKKDMVHMGQDETAKGMGNKFYFLMSSIFKISNASALVDKADRSLTEYRSKEHHISPNELQELLVTVVRSKTAPDGTQFQMVASKNFGMQVALGYYHSLRNGKYFGLGTSGKVRNPLLGDRDLGRTKIFDEVSDYRTARAMELTYQLFVIQSTWTLLGQPVDYSIPIETFAEKLMGDNSYMLDDILNTRGWWTYTDAKVDRKFMTLPNILMLINGQYRPKFLNLGAIPK